MLRISIIGLSVVLMACSPQTDPIEQKVQKQIQENNSNTEVEIVETIETFSQERRVGYIPFPDGYGYMKDLDKLQQATDEGNRKVIREHGWNLWAGIMQPSHEGGWPLWFTWPNTKLAFENASGPVGEQSVSAKKVGKSHSTIVQNNINNAPDVDTPAPFYPLPDIVRKLFPKGVCKDRHGNDIACDGIHFVNNGDIMIPTESLSIELMDDIRGKGLYQTATLDKAHEDNVHMINVQQKSIVTKHMYWPVKAKGITAIPVWKDNFPSSFTGYAGYEVWNTLVAIDPSGLLVGETVDAEFLYGVKQHNKKDDQPTVKGKALVYALDDFYFHKITQEDWDSFDEADKAILTAASYWANKQTIGVGDYLVTVAMHVNTKELASWTLQSVWWSDTPDEGIYSENRPHIPQAVGPWDHYLLTDAYAVPANPDGNVDIAVNPYIEGVIHPIATNCRNCHVRAGWPTGKTVGKASYQNPDCPGLLEDLNPKSECLKELTLTDYLWIIPDRAND